MNEIKHQAMDDEQDVDQDEEVVGVPEGVEAGDAIKGFWELHQAPAEPVGGESEGNEHQHHHQNSRYSFPALNQF